MLCRLLFFPKEWGGFAFRFSFLRFSLAGPSGWGGPVNDSAVLNSVREKKIADVEPKRKIEPLFRLGSMSTIFWKEKWMASGVRKNSVLDDASEEIKAPGCADN